MKLFESSLDWLNAFILPSFLFFVNNFFFSTFLKRQNAGLTVDSLKNAGVLDKSVVCSFDKLDKGFYLFGMPFIESGFLSFRTR